jgi:hypothetical protein
VARLSLLSVAPTVMAEAELAGDLPQASMSSFPAETTTVTPAAVAKFTAVSIAVLEPGAPMLALMTAGLSPFITTSSMASIAQDKEPVPSSRITLTAWSVEFLATPYFVPPPVLPRIQRSTRSR